MFRRVIDELNQSMKEQVYTLTGQDLYDLKKGFYEKSVEFMGHSKNLTGITELILNLYFNHFLGALHSPYDIQRNYKLVGQNGRENELDLAFLRPDGGIQAGISVKRQIGNAGWEKHEKPSPLYDELTSMYQSKNSLIQDLWRLENMKLGPIGAFPTVTIVFEDVTSVDRGIMKDITKNLPSYDYLVLQTHHKPLFSELKKKLQMY
ncbi:hypothetical protein SM124_13165 [Bacillus sp. 31A1R]|uniref:DUF4263 domain-containing protein n=1 Tax=Robertmurraya mangrovi TaxID=3098077 RepID=A0ABU5IZZ7_9BACI|nr:hypothetical protein [Bacillus sp. 31A1R]MDZ5472682.1 hypothetical protein [Bacillus sp. 31A1R]